MFNIVSLKPNPKVIFQTLERSLQSHRTDYTTVFTQWTSCVRSVEYPFNSRKKDSGHEMKPPRWTPDELFTKTCHFCVWVQEAKIYSSSSEGSAKTQIIILISSEWTMWGASLCSSNCTGGLLTFSNKSCIRHKGMVGTGTGSIFVLLIWCNWRFLIPIF